jgi:hypothetical protein
MNHLTAITRIMAEEGRDRFKAHAIVDGLSGHCVTKLMWSDMTDAGSPGRGVDRVVDSATRDGSSVIGEHQGTVRQWGVFREPLLEKLFHLGMQGDVAVGVQFPDRGS